MCPGCFVTWHFTFKYKFWITAIMQMNNKLNNLESFEKKRK